MTDKLQVDLIAGNAEKGISDVQKFRGEFVKADKDLTRLTANMDQNFSKTIATVERQSLNLAFNLRKISDATIGTKGFDGLGKAAQRAEADVRSAYNRLRDIERQAAITKDPAILTALQAEAAKTSADLDKLERKIERVSAVRAVSSSKLPTAQSIADNPKLRAIANAGNGLGLPGINEGSLALDAAAALGISTAALAAFAAVAAAGFAIVQLSKQMRAEAERRLKVEEDIAKAANKEILARKQALADFRKAETDAARSRDFQKFLDKATIADLEKRIELTKKLRDLDPTGPNAGTRQQQVLDAQAQVERLRDKKTADADANFNQRNENFKAAQKQAAEFEAEQRQKGIDKVRELQKTVNDLFAGLAAQRGASNPFVAVFTDAQKAIEDVRRSTAGLDADLRRQAEQLVATNNANNLFSARLDSTLRAVDLRSDAGRFRSPAETEKDFETRINDQLKRLGFDPKQLASLSPAQRSNFLAFKQSQVFSDAAILSNGPNAQRFNGVAIEDLIRGSIANARPRDEGLTATDRLDRQLSALNQLTPGNDAQRAEIERRIIALTQGLNPADLTAQQRDVAARARENEATRTENAEAEAKKQRAEAIDIQKRIDANIQKLLDTAQSEGLQGVIRIINDASDVATDSIGKKRRANPGDAGGLLE